MKALLIFLLSVCSMTELISSQSANLTVGTNVTDYGNRLWTKYIYNRSNGTKYAQMTRLKRDLLINYDKTVVPQAGRAPLNITFNLNVIGIKSFDRKSLTLTLYTWEQMMFTDNRLRWNPDEYGGIKKISLSANENWRPDIVNVKNGIKELTADNKVLFSIAMASGFTIYVPKAIHTVSCYRNGSRRVIVCPMKFMSWVYGNQTIVYTPDSVQSNIFAEFNNKTLCRFGFKDISAKTKLTSSTYACCEEAYPAVDIDVVLKMGKCKKKCRNGRCPNTQNNAAAAEAEADEERENDENEED